MKKELILVIILLLPLANSIESSNSACAAIATITTSTPSSDEKVKCEGEASFKAEIKTQIETEQFSFRDKKLPEKVMSLRDQIKNYPNLKEFLTGAYPPEFFCPPSDCFTFMNISQTTLIAEPESQQQICGQSKTEKITLEASIYVLEVGIPPTAPSPPKETNPPQSEIDKYNQKMEKYSEDLDKWLSKKVLPVAIPKILKEINKKTDEITEKTECSSQCVKTYHMEMFFTEIETEMIKVLEVPSGVKMKVPVKVTVGCSTAPNDNFWTLKMTQDLEKMCLPYAQAAGAQPISQ